MATYFLADVADKSGAHAVAAAFEAAAGAGDAEFGEDGGMRRAHAVATVRDAERGLMARLPDGALMARAATGLARVCAGALPRVYGARVVLLVGSGDNGGDALYAGAELARRGAVVRAVPAGSRHHKGGLAALLAAGGRVIDGDAQPAIRAADLVVDGLLGIGGRTRQRGLRAPQAALAAAAADGRGTVVAVDLPSGVDADTGVVAGAAVRADVTVTFGTYKPGLLIDPGATRAGVIHLVDIGLAPLLGEPDVLAPLATDVAAVLPGYTAESDKYRRGVLGVVAGGPRYVGAAVLASGAAVAGGAGMVRMVSAAEPVDAVRRARPEVVGTAVESGDGDAVVGVGRVQAWAIGPGIGTDDDAGMVLGAVLNADLPTVLDADALTLLSRHRNLIAGRRAGTLLTPHAGELARLLGSSRGQARPSVDPVEIEANRLAYARRAAVEYGCAVLLKGSTTIVADPSGAVIVNPTGTPYLATAGTGDVLCGLAGALLAGGCAPRDAGMAAAYLHGLAARIASAGAPIGAHQLLAALPDAFRRTRTIGVAASGGGASGYGRLEDW